MILDSVIENNNTTPSNYWIDLILEYEHKNFIQKYLKRLELNKFKSRVPDIAFMKEAAQAIQYLGKYMLYYNSRENSRIASFNANGEDVITLNLPEKDWRIVFGIKKNTVSMTIQNPDVLFKKKWNNTNINSVIENRYETYTFDSVTRIFMGFFIETINSYLK